MVTGDSSAARAIALPRPRAEAVKWRPHDAAEKTPRPHRIESNDDHHPFRDQRRRRQKWPDGKTHANDAVACFSYGRPVVKMGNYAETYARAAQMALQKNCSRWPRKSVAKDSSELKRCIFIVIAPRLPKNITLRSARQTNENTRVQDANRSAQERHT